MKSIKPTNMKNIERLLCNNMHDFVKDHINKITDTWKYLGFVDGEDMLSQIKSDVEIAIWALTELLWWGMDKNYTALVFEECVVSNNNKYNLISDALEDEVTVYKLQDGENTKYFKLKIDGTNYKITEIKKTKKVIEVDVWEPV